MRHNTTHAAVAVAVVLLAGCSGGEANGNSPRPSSAPTAATPKDQADKDLAVGEAYRYGDGVTFSVERVERLAPGPDDDQPVGGETAFRIHVAVTNEADEAFDLADLAYNAYDAETGEPARTVFVEAGARPPTGEIAANGEGGFTGEYAAVGSEVEFALIRSAEPLPELGDGPAWTGSIGK